MHTTYLPRADVNGSPERVLKETPAGAETGSMRRSLAFIVALAALSAPASAHAANTSPSGGFVVIKEMRSYAVTEIRDAKTGKVVASSGSFGAHGPRAGECGDARHTFFGAFWHEFEPYVVNTASVPSHVEARETLADIQAGHDAWENPFTTDCNGFTSASRYDAIYGGTTPKNASLVESLSLDGVNAVAFQSLAGTICDGAVACVVADFHGSKLREADLAFERDLTRYGYEDYWTTDDTTWFDSTGGRFAVVDVATHEFGHFAGLDHVEKSPALTMFPFIHDGDQSLGLGDMKGIAARY